MKMTEKKYQRIVEKQEKKYQRVEERLKKKFNRQQKRRWKKMIDAMYKDEVHDNHTWNVIVRRNFWVYVASLLALCAVFVYYLQQLVI